MSSDVVISRPQNSLTAGTGTADRNTAIESNRCAGQIAEVKPDNMRPDEAITGYRDTRQGELGPRSYYVDGACPNNGTGITGTAYGSWAKVEGGVISETKTFAMPDAKTNNEAEYLSLISLLEENPEKECTIYMDSQLVVFQVMGRFRVKEPRMKTLLQRVKSLIGARKVEWIPRKEIENVLGH